MKEVICIFPGVEIKLSLKLLTNLTMCRLWTKALSQWSNKLYLSPERRNSDSAFFFASELKRVDNDFEKYENKDWQTALNSGNVVWSALSSDNFISLKASIRTLELCLEEIKEEEALYFCQNIFTLKTKQFIIIFSRFASARGQVRRWNVCMLLLLSVRYLMFVYSRHAPLHILMPR